MRGFPPLHLIICAIAFALFAIPLSRLTFARPETVAMQRMNPAPPTDRSLIPTRILIRYAHQPTALSLRLGDVELIPQGAAFPASSIELNAKLSGPADGVELTLAATWPQGTPSTVLTVELEPDGLETRSQTRWSTGPQLMEVIPFNWSP